MHRNPDVRNAIVALLAHARVTFVCVLASGVFFANFEGGYRESGKMLPGDPIVFTAIPLAVTIASALVMCQLWREGSRLICILALLGCAFLFFTSQVGPVACSRIGACWRGGQ